MSRVPDGFTLEEKMLVSEIAAVGDAVVILGLLSPRPACYLTLTGLYRGMAMSHETLLQRWSEACEAQIERRLEVPE